MDATLVKEKIDGILNELEMREKKGRLPGIIVGAAIFVGLAALTLAWGSTPADLGGWLALGMVYVMAALLSGFGTYGALCLNAEAKARTCYLSEFTWAEDRETAHSLLAAVNMKLPMFRRLRRKLGIVLPTFRCSLCQSQTKVTRMGEVVECPKCKIKLDVPTHPVCPECGNTSIRIITPEEQVPQAKKDSRGKMAGALMYGPAGLIAGALLDGVKKEAKESSRASRVASCRHLYYCDSCKSKWGTTLRAARRSGLE